MILKFVVGRTRVQIQTDTKQAQVPWGYEGVSKIFRTGRNSSLMYSEKR
jgi:hypothetical protein